MGRLLENFGYPCLIGGCLTGSSLRTLKVFTVDMTRANRKSVQKLNQNRSSTVIKWVICCRNITICFGNAKFFVILCVLIFSMQRSCSHPAIDKIRAWAQALIMEISKAAQIPICDLRPYTDDEYYPSRILVPHYCILIVKGFSL